MEKGWVLRTGLMLAWIGAVGLLAPAHTAEVRGREIAQGDPAATRVLEFIQEHHPDTTIELLGKHRSTDPVTGHRYTVVKSRIGRRIVKSMLNEDTGALSTDAMLARREATALLSGLPPVYSKMEPELLAWLRSAQGGVLGGGEGHEHPVHVVLHASTAGALDHVTDELGSIAHQRFDSEQLWEAQPPQMHPDRQGNTAAPPAAARIFHASAEMSIGDLLRVGALDAAQRIELYRPMAPRLDVSVPRINADDTEGFGVDGFGALIGIIDTGIDDTHPNLFVAAEMDFTGAVMRCDGGSRGGATCASNCPGSTCNGRTSVCNGGAGAGMSCCPGGVCETAVGDTGGHGTHVGGIAANFISPFEGVAPGANLINAKAIPGANAPAALAFARGAGADVLNGSYGSAGAGCRGFCTAPAASVGVGCFTNAFCDAPMGAGNGTCGGPLGNPCVANANCDMPAGAGNGLCTGPASNGQSASTRAVDFEVFSSNLTVTIAAEERPFNGRCSNAAGTPCNGDAACPGGNCVAFASTPNDNHNAITVGSTSVTPGASTVSWFSQIGPTSDMRSKPDIVAPGEAPQSGICVGGGAAGAACNDVFGDSDCAGGGNCSPATCVGLCTAPAWRAGVSCTGNASCDSAVGTGDGVCAMGANFGTACTDTATSSECGGGGACRFITDNDGIDSTAEDWEGSSTGLCSAPPANVGFACLLNAECDTALGSGDGVCGTIPGLPPPGAANPNFKDSEGTSMAAPHVAGVAAQLWGFGTGVGVLTDTPYLKATILNTANRLAGWAQPGIAQPLDTSQGTGEVDALRAFKAYADDLRVWQQRLTGEDVDDSHFYWFDGVAGAEVTLTLVWERHESNLAGGYTMLNDLDLFLDDPTGANIDLSISSVDSVEHIVHTLPVTGRYCVEVVPVDLDPGGAPELYAVAGTPDRLNFTGHVDPCRPDFGDAPDPFVAPALYPTKLASNGARHADWTKEWLGKHRPEIDGELQKNPPAVVSMVDPFPSVSGEDDADDPFDSDGFINLVDIDAYDDGVVIPAPWAPLTPMAITLIVETTVDDTGFGPTGRYDAAVAAKRLYLNGWCDWDGSGSWAAGEKIVGTGSPTGQVPVDPETFGPNGRFTIGEAFTDSNGSGMWEPGEPFVDTAGATDASFVFIVTPPLILAPEFYCRFRVDYGEDVGTVANLSGTLAESVGEAAFGEVEDYTQGIEVDVFPETVIELDLRVPSTNPNPHIVTLTGPAIVHVDLGAIADTNGNSLEEAPTEMVGMELTGTSPLYGEIVVTIRDSSLDPFLPSTGQIEENTNSTASVLDLPPFVPIPGLCADSFFDIYFEVALTDLGVTLHNHDPKTVLSTIYHKPPDTNDAYVSPVFIDLFDPGESVVAAAGPGWHVPVPSEHPPQIDIFTETLAEIDLRFPAGNPEPHIVQLMGPTAVRVDVADIADTDGDGLEQVGSEMIFFEMFGFSDLFGEIIVRRRPSAQDPFQRTVGEIEENQGGTFGVLDLPPFVDEPPGLTASSYFNVFVEVELPNLGVVLHNHDPKVMSATLRSLPPAQDDVYESPVFIDLFDPGESLQAQLGPGFHIPSPIPLDCPGVPHQQGGPAVFPEPILALDPSAFVWEQPLDILWLVGDLQQVKFYQHFFVQQQPNANFLFDTNIPPNAGQGLYYLVRPACPVGSWQTQPDQEPQRDQALP